LFRAIYDYIATEKDELSVKKGTLFYIIEGKKLNLDWWYARAKDSGEEGYVPSNFLSEEKFSDVSYEPSKIKPIYPLFRGKCDFRAVRKDLLSFKKGSLLYNLKSKEINKNWLYVKAKDSGEEGYVPKDYLENVPLDTYE